MTNVEFIEELETRSMSSWSDAELAKYAVLTGQAEPKAILCSFCQTIILDSEAIIRNGKPYCDECR